MFSHLETGSDPPIGSDRELGCDMDNQTCPHAINQVLLIYPLNTFRCIRSWGLRDWLNNDIG